MGAMTAAIVGIGALGAATSVMGGMSQQKEANRNASAIQNEAAYNAGVYRQQAGMVEQQKQLKAQQDARNIRFVEGKTTAMVAAKGLEMSGSPMAILADTLTQMEMDKAISGYNYDMEKYSLESQAQATESRGFTLASQYRSQGRNAMTAGIIGGLTTFGGSLVSAGAYNYQAKTPAKTTVDTSAGAKIGAGV
jgi:hypothetical protein